MSIDALPERSIVLRLEFSIADAVHQRGLLPVVAAALAAWWNRPRAPGRVPDYLRADLGLPPAGEPVLWHSSPPVPALPDHTRRRRQ